MRRLTHYLIWLFVFTVPWDSVTLPLLGSMSRLSGLAAIGAAVLTTAARARFRRPDLIVVAAVTFAVWSVLSLLWTVAYGYSLQRAFTYAQLAASVWVIREFAVTREQRQSLLVAFCLGAFIPLVDLLKNFRANVSISRWEQRFSASGINANDLGVTLVIGIPIAWYLVMQRRGIVRILALAYFTLAPLAIVLTGTRGAFLAGLVALAIVPISLPRQSLKSYALAGLTLVVATVAAAQVVPSSVWSRISSTASEITEGGSMTGRVEVWKTGLLEVFPDHPILGVGAGAFSPAVQPFLNSDRHSPHSVPLAILVEQGLVGFCIYVVILVGCGRTIFRLPSPERGLWGVLMLSWFIGVLTINWEYAKATWMLFGLVAAHSGSVAAEARAAYLPRPSVLRQTA